MHLLENGRNAENEPETDLRREEKKLLNLGWGMEEFNPIKCKDWKPKSNS